MCKLNCSYGKVSHILKVLKFESFKSKDNKIKIIWISEKISSKH